MKNASAYPLFLNLARRPVLIVGGGAVAARKASALLESNARITIISPKFATEIESLKPLTTRRAMYASSHMALRPWRLVFAATDIRSVNAQVCKDARAKGILCCRCDEPSAGDFSNGAIARVGSVTVAISTGGASPGLASQLSKQAAGAIDPLLAELADLHRQWRTRIKTDIATIAARTTLLRRLAGNEMESHLRRGGKRAAEKLFARWLEESKSAGKKAAHAQ